MKKVIDIHGYADNDAGRGGKKHPLVHILAYESDGVFSSLTFKPKFAEKLCVAIMAAAEAALHGAEDFATEVKVKDWR